MLKINDTKQRHENQNAINVRTRRELRANSQNEILKMKKKERMKEKERKNGRKKKERTDGKESRSK